MLVFLTWDVLSAAWEPIDKALAAVHTGASAPPGRYFIAVIRSQVSQF